MRKALLYRLFGLPSLDFCESLIDLQYCNTMFPNKYGLLYRLFGLTSLDFCENLVFDFILLFSLNFLVKDSQQSIQPVQCAVLWFLPY